MKIGTAKSKRSGEWEVSKIQLQLKYLNKNKNMIGVMDLEISNTERSNTERSNTEVNNTEKVDNTEITAQVLSGQEKLSAQIVDTRKEIMELTETELKEIENVAKQYGRDSWKYSEYLKKNFKHIGGENSREHTIFRIL